MAKCLGDIAVPVRIISARARVTRIVSAFFDDDACRAFVIAEQGKPVGLVRRAAIMEMAAGAGPDSLEGLRAEDLARRKLHFADADMSINRLAKMHETMGADGFDPDIVVVKGGRVAGFVCIERLAIALADQNAGRARQVSALQQQLADRPEPVISAPVTPEKPDLPSNHDMLAVLAHEIRTPLTGIMGLADMLAARKLDGETRVLAETIVRSGKTLDRIVTDTLDYARLGAGRLVKTAEQHDLADLVQELRALWAPQADRRSLSLSVRHMPDMPSLIKVDIGRVRQIVNNLISNALKFTSKGGVTATIGAHTMGEQLILSIEVADTGPGISDVDKARLFEPFETQNDQDTPVRGWGLGLTISNAMANHLGGSLSVADNPGGGTAFNLLVPVERVRPTLVKTVPAPRSGKFTLGAALIVEDHEPCAYMITEALENAGWTIERVKTVAEAIARVARQRFQVILSDLHLPDGHASELTTMLRERPNLNICTPLIAVTADVASTNEQIRMIYGFDRVVRKPAQGPALVASVADVLMADAAGTLREPPFLRGRLAG